MSETFLNIVNMSISASWIVLVVVLFRYLFKVAPKWIRVVLWGIVAIRLICPITIETPVSLIPTVETINMEIIKEDVIETDNGFNNNINNGILSTETGNKDVVSTNEPKYETNEADETSKTYKTSLQVEIGFMTSLWILGIILMVMYMLGSYIYVKRRISTAIRLCDNVYESDGVDSPFVLGMISPKIYIPFNLVEVDRKHILAHEKAHIRRKDYWWKPLGFLILAVYWFNPLMWVAYILLCRDIELACDEKVIKELDIRQKADYSQTLLNCSVNRKMIAACPVAFGEVGVKDRVKSILNYKKPAFWVIIVGLVVSGVVAVCFLTNPKTTIDEDLSAFINKQIAEHNYNSYTEGNIVTTNHHVIGVSERGNRITVFIQAVYREYSYLNGELKEETGSYGPKAITVEKTEGEEKYKLIEYWKPRDGSYYASDINDKFPWYLYSKAINHQDYFDELDEACEREAKEYLENPDKGTRIFKSTVAYAEVINPDELVLQAPNAERLLVSSIMMLPTYKIDTKEALVEFNDEFCSQDISRKPEGSIAFKDVITKYDEKFFEENSLILIYIGSFDSKQCIEVEHIEYDDKEVWVHIEKTSNIEGKEENIRNWFVIVEAPNDIIKTCTEFNSVLGLKADLINK